MDYKRPGVFVEEISTLPPSVAPVATAIPAFVGYTEKAVDENGNPLSGVVIRRINTMLEYEQYFGSYLPAKFKLTIDSAGYGYQFDRTNWTGTTTTDLHSHLMYYTLRMYFDNGGGTCYIVSVDRYFSGLNLNGIEPEKIKEGIEALAKEDEPTLILLGDGLQFTGSDYADRCKEILAQCNKLKDRFGIFDLPEEDPDATQFRMDIGNNYLSYGCTFTPFLQSSLAYKYEEKYVDIKAASKTKDSNGLKFSYLGLAGSAKAELNKKSTDTEELWFAVEEGTLRINGLPEEGITPQTLVDKWNAWQDNKGGFSLTALESGGPVKPSATPVNLNQTGSLSLDQIKEEHTQYYNEFKKALSKKRVVMPPSCAMAGIFASVDRDRGVWKAPANVSLNSVIAPVRRITNEEQERLNVDPTSGKSINAIRSFAGKGTLVWGSRTLAGNDNEWRYIPVRRLFIFMEESLQKATGFAVFEPNNTTTWLKVKAMAESFLYNLWQRGALAGPTPESAYFVNVGLGKTMTPQDILEGRLIVEVGVAAVRPAEFIILRFMHKLQEA